MLKFGKLAIPYNRLVIEILRVEGGEGRGWMKDVVVQSNADYLYTEDLLYHTTGWL